MSYFSQISLADSRNLDAFGRLRTSAPDTLIAIQSQYNANPTEMEVGSTGTGVTPTHDSDTRMIELSATAGTGTSFLQTYNYFPYQPGKSQQIGMTGRFDTAVAGAIIEFGYFDAANGIIYRQNGVSGLQVVLRSSTSGSVVDNTINQVDWNIDKFDGTGPSGITLDPTKVFILMIDLQYLGMGRVRIGFDIDGVMYYAHQFLNANILTVPYMQTASLPVGVLITATVTGSTVNAFFKCCTVVGEGGLAKELGVAFSTPEGTISAASGARTHILSIRPRTTFNSIVNRQLLTSLQLEMLVTGVNPVYWELVAGAAFTVAPTFANINTTFSGTEYGINGTFLDITNGLVIASGYIAASATVKTVVDKRIISIHPVTLNRAGAQIEIGTFSLLVSGISGASATRSVMNFIELR